jgi:NAD(P)-dependent dehydrogenase (short-subunit alcohol dehydrogenase family)
VLLEGRNAVIYGGGGRIGSAVAEGFARDLVQPDLPRRGQGTPLGEMSLGDFEQPIVAATRTMFIPAGATFD